MASPSLLVRAARLLTRPIGFLSERLGSRFYLGLGVVVIAAAIYGIGTGLTGGMKAQAFDWVMRSRIRTPPPDPAIVLVDIDEASLAAMAPEYGRWPWPRSVMGELVEGLARAKPAAIVFDIVFSDLDRSQPESDLYFREVAASHPDTYFATIRLNPDNDPLSELRLAQLPGVAPLSDAEPQATAAMVVPYFFDVLGGRQLGAINLYADEDGITRRGQVYRDAHGWRIYSLAANVVAGLGGELPQQTDILLNWRGRPIAYRRLPFHDLYEKLLRSDEATAEELAGKILVIGSTAPSLFDIRPTPLSQTQTGLEILATVIDNLKNQDYLAELPSWVYMAVTAVAVMFLAAAFRSNVDWLLLRTMFTVTQVAFLAVTYLFVNYTRWFVDLTAPFTAAFAYFVVAGYYSQAMKLRRNGDSWYSAALDEGRTVQVLLLACRANGSERQKRRINGVLQRQSGLTHYGTAAPQLFSAAPLMQRMYEDVSVFYWLVPPERTGAALGDLFAMLERSLGALRKSGDDDDAQFALHATRFTVDEHGAWADQGKEAFLRELMLVQKPSRTFTCSEEFLETCRAFPEVTVPPELARADFG